jgi:hypothetical protein
MLEAARGASIGLYTRVLDWTEEAVDGWLEEVIKDMPDNKKHTYMPIEVLVRLLVVIDILILPKDI